MPPVLTRSVGPDFQYSPDFTRFNSLRDEGNTTYHWTIEAKVSLTIIKGLLGGTWLNSCARDCPSSKWKEWCKVGRV